MRKCSVCQIVGCSVVLVIAACGSDTHGADREHDPGAKSQKSPDGGREDGGAADASAPELDAALDAALDAGNAEADQGCGLHTQWQGDDRCIEPPDPSKGFQLHFGPANYDDADEVAKYVLEAGTEKLLCAYLVTPNEKDIYYSDWLNRMRPGSHHMIVDMVTDVKPAAPVDCGSDGSGADAQGLVGGNSTAVAPPKEIAPENKGLARMIPAHSGIGMQLHFFNATSEPLLMEAWQNIYYMDQSKVRELMAPIEGMAGLQMSVKPGTTEVIKGTMTAPRDVRIVDLYAHHHDHTQRFSAYVRKKGAPDRTLVYESFDWEHPALLSYDSIHENTASDASHKLPGGASGTL